MISDVQALPGLAATVEAASAYAVDKRSYDWRAFQEAQNARKPIVVHVITPWCETCKLQKRVIARLAGLPEFRGVTFLEADFDSNRDTLRALSVRSQSTFIVFRGGSEVARSVGEARPDAIKIILKKAISMSNIGEFLRSSLFYLASRCAGAHIPQYK